MGSQKRDIGMLYVDGLRLRGYGLVRPIQGKSIRGTKDPQTPPNLNPRINKRHDYKIIFYITY